VLSQLHRRKRNGKRIELLRFFRRNLCSIMNLHCADSTGSGVNVGACAVRVRGTPRGTRGILGPPALSTSCDSATLKSPRETREKEVDENFTFHRSHVAEKRSNAKANSWIRVASEARIKREVPSLLYGITCRFYRGVGLVSMRKQIRAAYETRIDEL